MQTITELAIAMADAFRTKVVDVYEACESYDAGFDLRNGIALQYAPYVNKPYLVSHVTKRGSKLIYTFASIQQVVDCLPDIVEKRKTLYRRKK